MSLKIRFADHQLDFSVYGVKPPLLNGNISHRNPPFVSFYWSLLFNVLENEKHPVLGVPLNKIPDKMISKFNKTTSFLAASNPVPRLASAMNGKKMDKILISNLASFFNIKDVDNFGKLCLLETGDETIVPAWIVLFIAAPDSDFSFTKLSELISGSKIMNAMTISETQLMLTKVESEILHRRTRRFSYKEERNAQATIVDERFERQDNMIRELVRINEEFKSRVEKLESEVKELKKKRNSEPRDPKPIAKKQKSNGK